MAASRAVRLDMEKTPVTTIWVGTAPESVYRLAGDTEKVEAPEVQEALEAAVQWMVSRLKRDNLQVVAGKDGWNRTLQFDSEADCLRAHELLLAETARERKFTIRSFPKPIGVEVLVVT